MTASDDVPAVVPGMADCIEARRRALGITPGNFAPLAGLTRQGLEDVRNGVRKRYIDKTIMGVAKALQWEGDWYERLQAGEQPVEAQEPVSERSRADEVTERLDALQDEVRQLSEQIAALTSALDQQRRQAGRAPSS